MKKLLSICALILALTSCKFVQTSDTASESGTQEEARVTPDLAFFSLKGNVKSVTYPDWEKTYVPTYMFSSRKVEFDQNGNGINLLDFFNGDDSNPNAELNRTPDGAIKHFSMNLEDFDGGWSFENEWADGKLVKFSYSGSSYYGELTIKYDDNGNPAVIDENETTQMSENKNLYIISNYRFDDRGNWTECDITINSTQNDYDTVEKVINTKHIRRIIEYYD